VTSGEQAELFIAKRRSLRSKEEKQFEKARSAVQQEEEDVSVALGLSAQRIGRSDLSHTKALAEHEAGEVDCTEAAADLFHDRVVIALPARAFRRSGRIDTADVGGVVTGGGLSATVVHHSAKRVQTRL
jgi:hypothetical protein